MLHFSATVRLASVEWLDVLAEPWALAMVGMGLIALVAYMLHRRGAALRQRERALRQSEERLRSVVENVADRIAMLDREGRIIFVNRAKLEPSVLIGQLAYDWMPKDAHEDLRRALDEVFRNGETCQLETRAVGLDGRTQWYRSRIGPVRQGQEIVAATFVAEDVTEERVSGEAMRQAKEDAERSSHAKSEFVANMSHEIRTPLNAVIGMSDMLLETSLSVEQRDFAETIRASSGALLAIINDVLDYSKVEAGRLDLEYEPVDLRACVEGAIDLIALEAAGKELEVVFSVEEGVPWMILGDVLRLRQTLLNLLSNAVKFTATGEIVVSVTSEPLLAGEHEIHFSVRDTGIGVPATQVGRIFESFRQVEASTARKYGGTGLGLAIAKRFAELMGGRMWVESAEGKGSTFHFTIHAREVIGPTHVAELDPSGLAGKRVLVVDDNETNRMILIRKLSRWGMEVRATGEPRQALAWIEEGGTFDLAILDLFMPDLDGMTLGRALRTLRDEKKLPLLLLGSVRPSLEEGDAGAAGRLGLFSAILVKPARPGRLLEAIRHACGVEGPPLADPPPVRLAKPDPPRLRILLAEDNRMNQKVALKFLERMGLAADVVEDGLGVLRALEAKPYDVILMDVQMPGMDGIEATRQVRQRWPASQQPRIIAMTANALQRDRERCMAAGMDDFLSKPVSSAALAVALEQCTPRVSQDANHARASEDAGSSR